MNSNYYAVLFAFIAAIASIRMIAAFDRELMMWLLVPAVNSAWEALWWFVMASVLIIGALRTNRN